ncbi:Glu/Leu/Phe/Val dehydrogenase dimerization domain-containing protein [Gordonia jinghuaiqii]|nr:Glu/Leu/Phe/Val dehydrogenase dimerization domain-containing protein [Gordonia jinghuaiqii]
MTMTITEIEEIAGADVWATEQLVLCSDERLGLRAVIAIDDSALGPALGGVRYASYPTAGAGVLEARRLARAMTLKNACAELPYGGAKSVIFRDSDDESQRADLMMRFGEFVARAGCYLPGVDMGTGTEDLRWMQAGGADVPSVEVNPSPSTAIGVLHAIRAAVRVHPDLPGLQGTCMVIHGVGQVGSALARALADAGAELILSDVDGDRARVLASELGASTVAPELAVTAPADVFIPCATARLIGHDVVNALNCRLIVGAANDLLVDDSVAGSLADAGIVYVPDFIANAGGVVDIDVRRRRGTEAQLAEALSAIGDRTAVLLEESLRRGETPLRCAQRLAQTRISAARREGIAR